MWLRYYLQANIFINAKTEYNLLWKFIYQCISTIFLDKSVIFSTFVITYREPFTGPF